MSGIKDTSDGVSKKLKGYLKRPEGMVEDIGQGLMDTVQTPEGIASVSGTVSGMLLGNWAGKMIKPQVYVQVGKTKENVVKWWNSTRNNIRASGNGRSTLQVKPAPKVENASFSNGKASKANVPNPDVGVVQSRINAANGRTRFTPTRPSTGKPVSAGFEHVYNGHFNKPLGNSRSIFSVTSDKLKQILQSPNVVKSTVIEMPGGQFKRIVDTGEIVGNTALKHGGKPTSWIEIITDRAGNLITTYPVPKP
jgi:hypothetical protein